MDDFLFSANIVFPIFFLILLGKVLWKIKMLTPEFCAKASKLIFNVALPASLFQSVAGADIYSSFSGKFILYAILSSLAILGVAWLSAKLLLRDQAAIGAVAHGSFRGNFAYIGLAVARSILGKEDIIPCVLLIVFVVPLYNILGTVILTLYGSKGEKVSVKALLLNIVKNPLIISILLAIPWSLCSWHIPTAFNTALSYLGQLPTPLALMLVGANLRFETLRKKKLPILLSTFFKIVFSPLLGVLCAIALGFAGEELVSLYVLYAVPSAVNTYIMAQNMDGDTDSAAGIVMMSTICSVVTMTIGVFLLRRFCL